MRRDEARAAVDDRLSRWRGDATRDHASARAPELHGVATRARPRDTRSEFEELELRVAQLEHRLRLLERRRADASAASPSRAFAGRTRATLTHGDAADSAAESRAPVGDRAGRGPARVRVLPRDPQADRPAAVAATAAPLETEIAGPARPAPARDARRARADVREVRAAALDAARHRPAGHHHRAARAPGRRRPFPFSEVERMIVEELGASARELFLEFEEQPMAAASIGQVHRAMLPERAARRGQGAAAGRAAPDRGRPRAALPGGAPREGAHPRARLHRRARARRRVRALDPARARLPAEGRNAERSAATSPAIRTSASRASTGATRAQRVLTLEFLDGTQLADIELDDLHARGAASASRT